MLKVKAIRQLGVKSSFLYFIYRLGITSGFYRIPIIWGKDPHKYNAGWCRIEKIIHLPDKEAIIHCINQSGINQLIAESDEIVEGKVRLFDSDAVDLVLTSTGPLSHWTAYESGRMPIDEDIKLIWEPARFGWAYTLARAYHLSGDEKYSRTFWHLTETFLESNPAYLGPHWMSAQEVALRLISLVFAWQVFSNSEITDASRTTALAKAIARHANRIPPTLIYARAQNNNHLVSEAAGLITAALAIPQHPQAKRWMRLGRYWFNRSLMEQIDGDGSYIQQSTNYHRLMLQLALWVNCLLKYQQRLCEQGEGVVSSLEIPAGNKQRLKLATQWLLSLADEISGEVPNLGPNDGAYIQPFCVNKYKDYRPVLQAASIEFTGKPAFNEGNWNEMSLWYGAEINSARSAQTGELDITNTKIEGAPHIIRNPASQSWGYLRTATFKNRPGHADQLHFDLWWKGVNIAQDAGSYSYNAPYPWNNALTKSCIHNTVTIDDKDQMTYAGKFLWLDWAQAKTIKVNRKDNDRIYSITAEQDGYQKMGILHRRSVTAKEDGSWLIEDQMQPSRWSNISERIYSFRIHWLLCDAAWELNHGKLFLTTLQGKVSFYIHSDHQMHHYQLVRAGELLAGEGDISPTWGWISPTYSVKIPALSFSVSYVAEPTIGITTEIGFKVN